MKKFLEVLVLSGVVAGGLFGLLCMVMFAFALPFVGITAIIAALLFAINAVLHWCGGIAWLGLWRTVGVAACIQLVRELWWLVTR